MAIGLSVKLRDSRECKSALNPASLKVEKGGGEGGQWQGQRVREAAVPQCEVGQGEAGPAPGAMAGNPPGVFSQCGSFIHKLGTVCIKLSQCQKVRSHQSIRKDPEMSSSLLSGRDTFTSQTRQSL